MPRIAVANDDEALLTLMQEVLEARGWSALTYSVKEGAFEHIKQARPDIAIIDVGWDAQASWRVLDQLACDADTRHVPIILSVGDMAQVQAREEWLQEHNIAVLPKPFDLDALYDSVESAMRRPRSRMT